MNEQDDRKPPANPGLRPRIRAIADDGPEPYPAMVPEAGAPSPNAFPPYAPVRRSDAPSHAAPVPGGGPVWHSGPVANLPVPNAPMPNEPLQGAWIPNVPVPLADSPVPPSASRFAPTIPMPTAGESWESLLDAAEAKERAEATPVAEAPEPETVVTPVPPTPSTWFDRQATAPTSSAWEAARASSKPPASPAPFDWQAAPEPAPTRVFDVSPSALASAPPPTGEPDLVWLHEPVQTETGSWSLDADVDDADTEVEQADLRDVDRSLIAALQEVLFAKASDLHITVNAPPTIRVDGALRPIPGSEVWRRPKVMAALQSILTDEQRETFERELELDFAYTISANARFRVNFFQQRGSIGAAFRLIPTDIKSLKELGIPDTVSRFAALARGLVLVTGPTGSGKSTTLAALVDLVNRTRADHIVTVEDPIEFLHENKKALVNQREVGPDTHSFGAALKHVLRQDPDVILIGELRDLETISVALTAAETGHLVFATLHTQDAAQTIDRVIDVFPPHQQDQIRAQLAGTLQGVVCQTLVKRASGKGRVVATEVMVATPAIGNLIREGKTYQIMSALQAGRDLGMYTMDQNLAELVDAGKITHVAALEKAHDAENLQRLIHRDDTGSGMSTAGLDFDDGYSNSGLR